MSSSLVDIEWSQEAQEVGVEPLAREHMTEGELALVVEAKRCVGDVVSAAPPPSPRPATASAGVMQSGHTSSPTSSGHTDHGSVALAGARRHIDGWFFPCSREMHHGTPALPLAPAFSSLACQAPQHTASIASRPMS
jgi:hypothetical protein